MAKDDRVSEKLDHHKAADSGTSLQHTDRLQLLKDHPGTQPPASDLRAITPDGKQLDFRDSKLFASVHDQHDNKRNTQPQDQKHIEPNEKAKRQGHEGPQSGQNPQHEQNQQERQERQEQQVRESFKSGLSDITDPDATIKSSVETANALTKASPQEQQKIFSDAANKFAKDNPNAQSFEFQSLLQTSLHTIKDNHQGVQLDQAVGILQDSKAKTEKNPSGITGTKFLGTGNAELDKFEKRVFDAEQNVAKDVTRDKKDLTDRKVLKPDEVQRFDQHVDQIVAQIGENGGFAPLTTGDALPKPQDQPSLNEIDQALQAKFSNSLNSQTELFKATSEAAFSGNQLATTKPAEMQGVFKDAVASLRQEVPGISDHEVAGMLSKAANMASRTNEFTVSSDSAMGLSLSEHSAATAGNKRGILGRAPGSEESSPEKQAAFDTALKIAGRIREGAAGLPESSQTPEEIKHFGDRVRGLFSQLRTD